VSRLQRCRWLIASLVVITAALVVEAADASPPSLDLAQTTYLRECIGQGAAANRRAYCQCSYQQLRRRYTLQQYTLLDTWIRSGPPELRRFAVVAWEPEFAPCRPLLQSGAPAGASLNRQPAASP